ncbi:hypothetical protein ASD24_23610 [Paenibacillus sp. Root52]|uniref:hypothetical protein n=1 Tax=Paenibacillus sp. Root52 TaxID=1736552 RepID=UPI0006FFB1ED|nr:hypothetical protein [Paenibacillus sp. Root52]KQY91111.1 hypothetical protein ASD24_23610 [Paenibacillus sp. Root52]
MAKPLVTLSIEEFGFALATLGAEDIAAGLLKPMYGELSEQHWELVLRAASHSLLSKGLIVRMEETEIEIEPEFLKMLMHFAQSRGMIRAYSDSLEQEKVLTIHQGTDNNDKYLYHLAVDQRVHLFTWTEPKEWEEELFRFYTGQQEPFIEQPTQFKLTEEQWNVLTNEDNRTALDTLMNDWEIPTESHELLTRWHESFEASGRQVDNLSIIRYTSDQTEIPLPDQALLMLHTEEGFWSISNNNASNESEASIEIIQHSRASFRTQLRSWIDRFAVPVSHP